MMLVIDQVVDHARFRPVRGIRTFERCQKQLFGTLTRVVLPADTDAARANGLGRAPLSVIERRPTGSTNPAWPVLVT
jgi:hypothetical protein